MTGRVDFVGILTELEMHRFHPGEQKDGSQQQSQAISPRSDLSIEGCHVIPQPSP